VVEDERPVAELFQRALQDAGYQAEILANGYKAQARLVFTTPDLVLLDLHLPSLSGEVILRQVHGQRRLGRTRILVVSGDPVVAQRHERLADRILIKPVGYEQLRRLAEQYLSIPV
jgi:two-component system response regulator MtrA